MLAEMGYAAFAVDLFGQRKPPETGKMRMLRKEEAVMPTIEQNRATWESELEWAQFDAGERWSDWWGGAEAQWRFSLLPRISRFVPAATILEIAPGFGRWTQFLKDLCDQLVVVDLSQRCIDACRQRFAQQANIAYFRNDGYSLGMVPDNSVDFAFSFDSLVHADADVLEAYIGELARVLRPDGVCFIHHSNWGAYPRYAAAVELVPTRFRLKKALARLRIIEGESHARARDMTAERFDALVRGAGLQCIGQETINWCRDDRGSGGIKRLIDCMSTFTRPESKWATPNVVVRNPWFTSEAAYVRAIAPAYLPREHSVRGGCRVDGLASPQ